MRKVQLRYWFILFLSTGLITTACKTSQLTNKNRNKNLQDTTNTNTQLKVESNKILVSDSIILNDTTALKLNGDCTLKVQKESFLEDKVDYNAMDSIVFDVKGKLLFLYDTAEIKYQEIELQANLIEINMEKKELWGKGSIDSLNIINGKPHFKQGEQSFDAKEIGYNFETKTGLIKEAFTNQGEVYLHADIAKKDSNEMIYVKNVKFTT